MRNGNNGNDYVPNEQFMNNGIQHNIEDAKALYKAINNLEVNK